jgi:hypothetical protein
MTTACVLCGYDLTPVEIQTCALCVSMTRLDLTSVEHCYALLRVQIEIVGQPAAVTLGTVMGVGDDAVAISDALVMLGPGSASHEGHPSDPPAVAFELATWCEDWAGIRREQTWPVTMPALTGWLGTRLGWAMSYHPAADEFAHDMARIRTRLEQATDTADYAERGASCPYCGTVLLRAYGDKGRADDWSCPRCHRDFNDAQYLLALRAALEANT